VTIVNGTYFENSAPLRWTARKRGRRTFMGGGASAAGRMEVYLTSINVYSTKPGNGIWIFSCICANLFCMALYGNYFARLLSLPPLQILGKCSFSVYLWHIPVIRAYLIAEKRLHLFDLAPKL